MLHVGDGGVVEAVANGVVQRSIELATAGGSYAHACRLKGLSADTARKIADDAFERQALTVSRHYPSMTNPGDIAEYSQRNPTTFPKIGEIELPPDIGWGARRLRCPPCARWRSRAN